MDIPIIEQAKIQAQVLVPLVKALRKELGEGRAAATSARPRPRRSTGSRTEAHSITRCSARRRTASTPPTSPWQRAWVPTCS
jgi:hypothetical protein